MGSPAVVWIVIAATFPAISGTNARLNCALPLASRTDFTTAATSVTLAVARASLKSSASCWRELLLAVADWSTVTETAGLPSIVRENVESAVSWPLAGIGDVPKRSVVGVACTPRSLNTPVRAWPATVVASMEIVSGLDAETSTKKPSVRSTPKFIAYVHPSIASMRFWLGSPGLAGKLMPRAGRPASKVRPLTEVGSCLRLRRNTTLLSSGPRSTWTSSRVPGFWPSLPTSRLRPRGPPGTPGPKTSNRARCMGISGLPDFTAWSSSLTTLGRNASMNWPASRSWAPTTG